MAKMPLTQLLRGRDTFGYWKVIEECDPYIRPGNGFPMRSALCKCICGTLSHIQVGKLLRGSTKSCGCKTGLMIGKSKTTHGMCRTEEYRTWSKMKSRCQVKSDQDYNLYGGRGIKVCDEWKDDFLAFFEYMGKRPTAKHSIDRIDVNGNYEPGNCRWATISEQASNKRNNLVISVFGEIMTLSEASRKYGISGSALRNRLDKGWTHERAVSTPLRRHKNRPDQ